MLSLRTRPDKFASVCLPFGFGPTLAVRPEVICEEGAAVVCRVLTERSVYGDLELTTGRTAKLIPGDVIVGVMGNRAALKGFSGRVPASAQPGDTLHLLNLGGVIGISEGVMVGLGEPIKLEAIGSPLIHGEPARLGLFGVKPIPAPRRQAPVIAVAGTCMNSGKSTVVSSLVRWLRTCELFSGSDTQVHAGKLTGVGAIRDPMSFRDHGASLSMSFLDCGIPSTAYRTDTPEIANLLLDHLMADEPDVIVLELGDGLLGAYGVDEILADPVFAGRVSCIILAANDVVGAVAGAERLTGLGYSVACISGPATDNKAGVARLRSMGWQAANVMREPKDLFDQVFLALGGSPA